MNDNELTDDDCAALKIDRKNSEALQSWILERIGYVFGKTANGGSGVFVRTRNDEVALLTASHVVIAAILSGELSIGAYDAGSARFKPGSCITFSCASDSALVTADDLSVPLYLSVDDWSPAGYSDVDIGARLVGGGLPGAWKGHRAVERRVVQGSKVMLLWSEVIDVRRQEVELLASRGLPKTLRGMSGGPLFTYERELVGIHRAERRNPNTNMVEALLSTRRDRWMDLYDLEDSCEWPTDLEGPPFRWEQRATFGPQRVPVLVGFEGFLGTSPSQPSHPRGAFGRVEKMRILNSDETRQYPINLASNFFFGTENDDSARIQALRDWVRDTLPNMGMKPVT